MKKGSHPPPEKLFDSKSFKLSSSQIKFNLSSGNLACFKGKERAQLLKPRLETAKELKFFNEIKSDLKCLPTLKDPFGELLPERIRTISSSGSFNEKVVFMQYDNIDVYIDKSTRKKSNSNKSKSSKERENRSVIQESEDDEFVSSCVRVITEQTDNTSNHLSLKAASITPQNLTPRSSADEYYEMIEYYQPRERPVRNRRSVTFEQSKNFAIDFNNIELDGRTTVMVKNIPNKYTQQMLIDDFSINHENKFDFFYLPIDKDNECNVGYAFLNFINTSYLKAFYQQFHMKKWRKYKSPKICNICYARYQGTLELANHFRDTKVLQQKDKKLRPLIGLSEANKIKDIGEIIKNQQSKQ